VSEIDLGLRVLLAAVFLVAAAKLRTGRERAAFLDQVRAMTRTPERPARLLAAAVAAAEVVVIPLLLVPSLATAGLVLAAGLLAAFLAGSARAVRSGDPVPCRCFGFGSVPIGRAHLWRDGLLLSAAGLALPLPHTTHRPAADLLVPVLGGLAGALVAVLSAEFAALLGGPASAPGRSAGAHPEGIR